MSGSFPRFPAWTIFSLVTNKGRPGGQLFGFIVPRMRCRPDQDRLAVWTYEEAGEQIPNGDPSVTDAERAAAGRETLAERFAAVLPANRKRAAERYAAGGLPDGQDVARVWRPRDQAELRVRLTEPPLAF